MAPVHGPFHQPAGISQAERKTANIREFTGDGTAELRVPGIKSVSTVMIGRISIPMEQDYKFPTNSEFGQKVHTTLPVIAIREAADGCPILLRSTHSNDGMWQAGHKIYVGGEWDDTPSASPKPSAAAPSSNSSDAELQPIFDELMKMNVPDLKARASGMNIVGVDSMKKEGIAWAIARAADASQSAQ